MPLPPYLRVGIYKAFGTLYGVNYAEAVQEDLNKFRTFNQFFTRELKAEVRPIAEQFNDKSLVSPCDGTVLSLGDVNAFDSTIECVKGNAYRLDEFLFGYQTSKDGDDHKTTAVDRMLAAAKERGNKVMYAVVYLSPGDYHRYHSPAIFTANYRRHIAGYLEPVDPRYLKRHTGVLKSNERVNVLGDWAHGFFAISFVGATNVGSIKINFDDTLQTNCSKYSNPKIPSDRNYTTLSTDEGACRTYPVRKTKLKSGMLSNDSDNDQLALTGEGFNVDSYLDEFDIKDMTYTGRGKDSDFSYAPQTEQTLLFNVINGFKTLSHEQRHEMA